MKYIHDGHNARQEKKNYFKPYDLMILNEYSESKL